MNADMASTLRPLTTVQDVDNGVVKRVESGRGEEGEQGILQGRLKTSARQASMIQRENRAKHKSRWRARINSAAFFKNSSFGRGPSVSASLVVCLGFFKVYG
ncbi:hypothetical protein JG688_00006354 [Phytophthora aleatoria]|uniref:Uncharacterized protein n=1 Tax=Phytophthora aleatoria TaxID=2496075 RepID=A0A8J5M7V1_9STRA|nr:hypothetical protein JG688_00006354 [Phytophthora aleatoria]